ncbi:Myb/SANT-like DNA-binding domain protein [Rhynchospora pubera]|uniref:Myb/SANT-like DNA-binding domain protein n=1 Tax=Rhynchospora pubera TaxID=906938 RepID=A0AAV8FE86_9POAL|nr:Myb/SANT-like DNA-binding domain protein [Rhynchospora pubera]
MGKTKRNSNSSPNATTVGRGESLVWTHKMDEALVDAFVLQHILKNRNGGTFTSHAYDQIVKELKEAFPDKPIDKEKVKNRMKYIKRGFGTCYDLFRNISGFGWNPITHMFDADSDVWDRMIKDHPEAAEWMNKPILHYDKLKRLYGKDRANGDISESPEEMMQRLAQEDNQPDGDVISEIDRLISRNEATLGDLDDDNLSSPNGRKKHKGKATKEEIQADIMKGIEGIGEYIMKSTEAIVKAHNSQLSVPATEIWDVVLALNLDTDMEMIAYRFLIKNSVEVEALIGCPLEKRKDYLMRILPRS